MEKRKSNRAHIYILIITIAIIFLAFVDAVVMENIYKSIQLQHEISWQEFEIIFNILNSKIILTQWNFALIVITIVMFLLLGLAAMDWKLGVSGIILFATGWEDLAYYTILLEKLPKTLEWLDYNPLISWTRIITQSSHVTNIGLVISALIGLLIVILIFSRIAKFIKSLF